MSSLLHFIDPVFLINTVGLIGVIAVIFIESGLFFGFFLPGDSLLFSAGLLASQGHFSFTVLAVGAMIAAIAGDSVGYWFGRKIGPKIFVREDSFFFRKSHIARAQHFYEKHGTKTIILARFVPIVRTFAPIVAGVGTMHYGTFLRYNIIGGIFWVALLTSAGYFLGQIIPNVDQYLLPIIFVIIFVSFIPVAVEYYKAKKGGR